LEQRDCDMNAAYAVACENLGQIIRERGAVVTRDELPVLPAHLEQMTLLLQNLIANAIKFTPTSDAISASISR
jgi:signal transduction histidine kinase